MMWACYRRVEAFISNRFKFSTRKNLVKKREENKNHLDASQNQTSETSQILAQAMSF